MKTGHSHSISVFSTEKQQVLSSSWHGRPFGLMSRKEGELLCNMDPHLKQCGRGRGLPPCQVSSWSMKPFGHNAQTLQTDRTRQNRQRSDSIGRTVLQTPKNDGAYIVHILRVRSVQFSSWGLKEPLQFLGDVCKTFRPMLSDSCLSVCPFCL